MYYQLCDHDKTILLLFQKPPFPNPLDSAVRVYSLLSSDCAKTIDLRLISSWITEFGYLEKHAKFCQRNDT